MEAFALAVLLPVAGLGFPLAALVFALANLRGGAEARILFGSAATSAALALMAGLALAVLPGLMRPEDAGGLHWQSYAIPFVYAWALLDFWRGARLTGARPRIPAIVAGVACVAVAAAFLILAI